MGSLVGDLLIRIAGDNKQFGKVVQDSGKKAETLQKKLAAVGEGMARAGKQLTKFVTLPILAIGVATVKAASDAEESLAKFNTVFGDQADAVEEWADEYSSSVNRSKYANLEMLSSVQDLFVPLGAARDEAAELSKAVLELATDVGSFNNLPTEQVIRDIQSALVGNHETVRKYGVVISEATLKTQGITSESSNLEKALGRLKLITEGTTDAQGDAVRTADSFANQFRGLKDTIKDLGIEFGQVLLPIAKDIIQAIRGVVDRFSDMDTGTKELILKIAGLAAVTGPLLIIIPKLAGAITALGAAMHFLAANPIVLLIGALAALTAAVVLYIKKKNEASGALNTFEQRLDEVYTALDDLVYQFEEGNRTIDESTERFNTMAKELGWTRKQLVLWIDDMGWMSDTLAEVISLQDDETEAIKDAATARTKAVESELKGYEDTSEAFQTSLQKILDGLDLETKETEKTTRLKLGIEQGYFQEIEGYNEQRYEFWRRTNEKIVEDTRETYDFMAQFAQDNLDAIEEKAKEITPVISGFVNSIGNDMEDMISGQMTIWESLKKAALNAIADVVQGLAAQAATEAAIGWARVFFGNLKAIPGAVKMSAAALGAAVAAGGIRALANAAIPKAAQGGLFNSPYIGGEAGPEYAIPDQAPYLNSLAAKIESAMGNASINNENMVHVTVNLGSEMLYDDIRKATNDGRLLINTRALV